MGTFPVTWHYRDHDVTRTTKTGIGGGLFPLCLDGRPSSLGLPFPTRSYFHP